MSDNFYGGGGGGGYDTNQGGYDSNASPSNASPGGERKAIDRSEQNLLPLTIKQINTAALDGDKLSVDGKVLHQVKLIAAIRDFTEHSTNISFTVEDGTGEITTKLWLDEAESDEAAMKRTEWAAGTYIQVIGQVKDNHGKRTVMAYNIQTVKDFNMITYHFLEAMHVHALALKGQGSSFTAQASTSGLVHAAAPHGDSLLAQQAQVGDDGMSPIQQDILKVFKSQANFADDTGLDVKIIMENMVGRYDPAEIRMAVGQLSDEGHLYSTIDDEHYAVT